MNNQKLRFTILANPMGYWLDTGSFATVSSLEAEPVLENLTIITIYHFNLKIMAYFKKTNLQICGI